MELPLEDFQPGLHIVLDREHRSFTPDEQVRGIVELISTKDVAIGTVIIRLCGRSITKIWSASGQSRAQFEGLSILFDNQKELYSGHYTHRAGTYSWPFFLAIPGQVDHNLSSPNDMHAEEHSHPDLEALPVVANIRDSRAGKELEATIEYSLEAVMTSPKGKRSMSKFPILISSDIPSIDLNDPTRRVGQTQDISIRTRRLLPDHHPSQVSLLQRSKGLFKSSTTPSFSFEVDVSHPSVLQIGSHEGIPFIIGVRPLTDSSRTSMIPSQMTFYRYPSVTILSVNVVLQARTDTSCPTLVGTTSAEKESKVTLLSRQNLDHRLIMRSLASDQKTGAPAETIASINLGSEYNMRPAAWENIKHDQDALVPSFRTANICHSHTLTWEVEICCAGEKRSIRSKPSQSVILLNNATEPPASSISVLPCEAAPVYAPADLGPPPFELSTANASHTHASRLGVSNVVQQIMRDAKTASEAAFEALPTYDNAEHTQVLTASPAQELSKT